MHQHIACNMLHAIWLNSRSIRGDRGHVDVGVAGVAGVDVVGVGGISMCGRMPGEGGGG